MSVATYKKLTSGAWGLRVEGDVPAPGSEIEVVKASGDRKREVIDRVLWTSDDKMIHICSIQRTDAPAKPVPVESKLPFLLPDRTLVRESALSEGVFSSIGLSDVAERLQTLNRLQEPTDHQVPLSRMHVDFTPGHVEASWIGHVSGAPDGRSYLMTSYGASQLASQVLPSRFFPGLRQLAKLDTVGADLATRVWSQFALRQTRTMLVRTLRMKIDGDIRWVVRSCHTTSYAAYSNLDLVLDIRDNGGNFSSMPVLSWWVTDTGMRIRFYAIEDNVTAFMNFDPDAVLNEPIPMIEVWNSEVGRRSVGFRAGLFRMVSQIGIPAWSDRTEHSWVHRGSSLRIRGEVQTAFSDLIKTANEVVEVYRAALAIQIEGSPEDYMVKQLTRLNAGESVISKCREIFGGDKVQTTPAGTLAYVVDVIALAAADSADMYTQHDIEKIASQVLIRGYRDSGEGEKNLHAGTKED